MAEGLFDWRHVWSLETPEQFGYPFTSNKCFTVWLGEAEISSSGQVIGACMFVQPGGTLGHVFLFFSPPPRRFFFLGPSLPPIEKFFTPTRPFLALGRLLSKTAGGPCWAARGAWWATGCWGLCWASPGSCKPRWPRGS